MRIGSSMTELSSPLESNSSLIRLQEQFHNQSLHMYMYILRSGKSQVVNSCPIINQVNLLLNEMKGTKVLTLGAVGMSSHGFRGHIGFQRKFAYMRRYAATLCISPISACALFYAHKMADRSKPYRNGRCGSLTGSLFRKIPSIKLVLVTR